MANLLLAILETNELPNRDVAILEALLQFGWLSIGQIDSLIFLGNQGKKSTNRRVAKLLNQGFIMRREALGTAALFLTPKGHTFLGSEPKADIRLPGSHLPRSLEINDFRVGLTLALLSQAAVFLKRFISRYELKQGSSNRTGRACYKLFQTFTHPQTNQTMAVFPDAAMLLSSNSSTKQHLRLCFLQLDGGQHRAYWLEKASAYHGYWHSGKFRKYGKVPSFTVLITARSEKRQKTLWNTLRDHQGANLFLIAVQPNITSETLLSQPIWLDHRGVYKRLIKPQNLSSTIHDD